MSPYRHAEPKAPAERVTWWQVECEQMAAAALATHCRRLALRMQRRAVHFAGIAERLRRRRPWCRPCGRRVERYVVVHELGEERIGLRVQCHGVSRVRDVLEREVRYNFVAIADWLGVPVF